MKTYAFVFARGGSKGVPGKNIRKLAGKSLLAYSIDLAKGIEMVDKIFVSTEDETIASIALEHDVNIIDRPEGLALDNTPEWLVWQHAVKWLEERGEKFDVFLSLPTTSPLRNKSDIYSSIKCLDENTDVVLSMTVAARSPSFNMVRKTNDGFIELLMKNNQPIHRRQDAPKIYDLTTVAYVTRPKFIKSARGIFEGRVKSIEIPAERAIDIDSELDFEIAEFLIYRLKKINKEKANAR